ncbi:MAG: SDR family NAD(P)-dependent oxidoreductase, partial [Trueperaceae bacterium]
MNYRDLFDLTGRNALVIGGGSGIGRATAKGLADFGATVTVADTNLQAAETAAAELKAAGYEATGVQVDITNEAQVRQL